MKRELQRDLGKSVGDIHLWYIHYVVCYDGFKGNKNLGYVQYLFVSYTAIKLVITKRE